MSIKLGINGFGRIGRLVFRNSFFHDDIRVVAINDLMDIDYISYMLKYDSSHGIFKYDIKIDNNKLLINDKCIYVSSIKNPKDISWKKYDVDIVIESTGIFLTKELCYGHILSGAKNVIMTGPSKDDTPMFVMGVNHYNYNGQDIVSNASCTTNCLAPIIKVLNDNFKVKEAFMTTIHASTATQKVVDSFSFKDWRGGRSVFQNIIPSSTGAANAIGLIIPELKGKITGMAFRVPVSNVSVIDLTVKLSVDIDSDILFNSIKEASNSYLRGILGFVSEDVVSSDFNGNKLTSIFDFKASMLLNSKFIKVVSWYDNETAYSDKVLDLASYIYYYN